jgi:hypothetical protein
MNTTPKPVKDEQREKDIQVLCKEVLNLRPNFYDNPCGGYENTCPFCSGMEYGQVVSIDQIKHTPTCAYLIAKDLSTGLV